MDNVSVLYTGDTRFKFRLRHTSYGQNYCDVVWSLQTNNVSYFKLRHIFLTFQLRYLLTTLLLKVIIVITYSIVQSITHTHTHTHTHIYIYIYNYNITLCAHFLISGNVLSLLHFPSWRQVLHLYLYWCWLSHIDKLMPP